VVYVRAGSSRMELLRLQRVLATVALQGSAVMTGRVQAVRACVHTQALSRVGYCPSPTCSRCVECAHALPVASTDEPGVEFCRACLNRCSR